MTDLPTTYVSVQINGLRVYADREAYSKLLKGMMNNTAVEFLDVEGELNVVQGKYIDLMWISTLESREIARAHGKLLDSEVPKRKEWETND